MHDFGDRHSSMKLKYRFYTGFIFAFAAAIAMPIFYLVISIFVEGGGPPAKKILGSAVFGAMFSIAAFFWGVLLTSRFRVSEDKKLLSTFIILFLWGCVITALTMFSTGFFIGIFESIKHMELPMKAIGIGLFVWGAGSIITFGTVYVVGGIAGIITGIIYNRIPHNEWLVRAPDTALHTSRSAAAEERRSL